MDRQALTISLGMNDFSYWRETEEYNGKYNIREAVPYIWQQVQVHVRVLAALPEVHGSKWWLHGSLNSS